MNTRVFAVAALLCASINGAAPNGVNIITFDGKFFKWSESQQTYLNNKGQSKENLMLEEYARPVLGQFDEDSGLLALDMKEILKDNNSNLTYLKDLEKSLNLFSDQKFRAVEHNIQREKIIETVPDLLRTWEIEMTGPQPYASAIKFTAETDIERYHLPENMIAGPNFDLGEWLYPIKEGEECWRIETFGQPWYFCPESQVKDGCIETFNVYPFGGGFLNKWVLECENNDSISFEQTADLSGDFLYEEVSMNWYESRLDLYLEENAHLLGMERSYTHVFRGITDVYSSYDTVDNILGESWTQRCDDHGCSEVQHQKLPQ